ncbi:penicillin acylase family protein [Gandjariella thermophila]|uniref:Penicillin acylase n=1 Tax=Gandjariella thermophila TaxID=1931992 RepID=A0A4D4JEX8_9PSEU|nr:penicillin acylase family protein [Gandjariella thermophila]GDY32869.1 penicillin acylase [Gandjariella thermophila]
MSEVRFPLRRATGALAAALLALATASANTAGAAPAPTYRADDYADGNVLSVNPPGENGLVNAAQLAQFEATGQRPANSTEQRTQYANLLHGYPSLTDAALPQYYNDESFGVRAADVTRTEQPAPSVPVTIYRDRHDIPHVYGSTDAAMSFGAGYAQAEDRLFEMDVLRHYGQGTLSAFLGPSCANEQMDHDELLLAPYTEQQAQTQIDALPTRYGAQGALAKQMIDNYVAGVNAYIAATATDPSKLPADYAAALAPPQPWKASDVVYVAALIGGIFGNGGGGEVRNAALLQYLQRQLGRASAGRAFTDFREQNDGDAPTTITGTAFPYEIPGRIDPAKTAMPDDAAQPLAGGPAATTPGCDLVPSNATANGIVASLLAMPAHMSNALLVDAAHSADGHPIAVFGPQVSYFAPGILVQEDLHSPDYAAEGASFPGTGLVELGRGEDYAWSATSAGSDLTDQRLERICDPAGGTPPARGTYYEFDGQCLPMTHETFHETAVPKPGGAGAPAVIDHDIYLTRHGVVQGWTTAEDGKPTAVVNQRTTYQHEVDSVIGFLRWAQPAQTHDAASWMAGAAQINYTFNWFYVDAHDIAYYSSGMLPIRSDVDPNLPTWGTGSAEWQGFLAADAHPHEVDPPSGYFVNWNNKPAPRFSAADNQYGYGPVYRSQLLDAAVRDQLAAHGGRIGRANLVQAMETAATQDLDGVAEIQELLGYLGNRPEPPGVAAMLNQLRSWSASGAHRRKAAPGDAQYADHAAVAIMDVVQPALIRAIFDPLLAAGGLGGEGSTGGAVTPSYTVLPMQWVNTPNSGGAHLGSAYDAGYEGYVRKVLRQLRGEPVAQPFGPGITGRLCGAGPASCPSAFDAALASAYHSLVDANGGATDVASWTSTPDTVAAKQTMPQYDAIQFRSIGIVGQDPIDWQNRPTFQQVVEFPRHRP